MQTQNEITHRIANFAGFYQSPYLPFPVDKFGRANYSIEVLNEWMKENSRIFHRLDAMKEVFLNPTTNRQRKFYSMYCDLRQSFRELPDDLRDEFAAPNKACARQGAGGGRER